MEEINWNDMVGGIGVVLILGSYLWLQLGKIRSSSLQYSVVNGVGAAMIAISLLVDFNLYALIVEVSWMLISVIGVVKSLIARRDSPGKEANLNK